MTSTAIRIQQTRLDLGMSVRSFADAIGVTLTAARELEQGQRRPTPEQAAAIDLLAAAAEMMENAT